MGIKLGGGHGVYEIINKAHVVVERKSRNRFFYIFLEK